MRILNILTLFVLAVMGIFLTSCSKKTDGELFQSTTDLQVYVKDGSGQKIQGVDVKIFLTESDRDNNVNVVQEGNVSVDGYAYFAQLQTVKYYILATRATSTGVQTVKSDSGAPLTEKLQTGVTIVM